MVLPIMHYRQLASQSQTAITRVYIRVVKQGLDSRRALSAMIMVLLMYYKLQLLLWSLLYDPTILSKWGFEAGLCEAFFTRKDD